MRIHRTSLALISSALVLASCGTASSGTSPTATPTGERSAAAASVGPARGVATDETCIATTAAGPALGGVGVALNDLMGMVLDRSALGASGADWQEGSDRGFLENQELTMFGFGGKAGCDKLTSTGRVTGYASAWMNYTTTGQAKSAAHLFLTEDGAAAFVAWYPTLMKVGDSAGEGITVSSVRTVPQPALGDGAVLVDVAADGWTSREVAFRVKNLVGVVTVGARTKDSWPVDPEKLGPLARDKLSSAPVSDEPLDAVVALSLPLQRTAFPKDLATLPWDAWFGGTLDAFDSAGMSTGGSVPEEAARMTANGFLYSARGFYMGQAMVPKISSSVSVYTTPETAATDRAKIIADAVKGDPATGAATLYDVGIPGAVGWTREVAGGEGSSGFVDTRVLLPATGHLLPCVFIHDTKSTDRRADVVRLARLLQERMAAMSVL